MDYYGHLSHNFFLAGCSSSGYKEKDGKITFNGKEVTDKSFVILNEAFAKNDSIVYFKEYTIPDADINTFTALDGNYAKDKQNVYYCDEEREGQNYYLTKQSHIVKIENVDPATFNVLGEGDEGYAKDANRAYFKGVGFQVKDPATLTFVESRFLKDKQHVYFEQQPVKIADVHSFRIINRNYARDTSRVFYYGFPNDVFNGIHEIPCKAASFSLLDYPFSKDNESAFFFYSKIPLADASSFVVLNNSYSKDKQHVFLKTKIIPGADPTTFGITIPGHDLPGEKNFTRDKNHIFWKEKILKEADAAAFEVLGLGYATDGKHIFFQNIIVKNANPKSFKVMQHGYDDADAEDEKSKFLSGKMVILD